MIINLKWDTGELNLNLELFFPAKKYKIKKLNKILKMCTDETEKRNEIKEFLKEKISKGLLKDKYLKNAVDLGLKTEELEIKNECYI